MQNMNSKFTIKTKPVPNQPVNTDNIRRNSKRNDNIGSKEDLKSKKTEDKQAVFTKKIGLDKRILKK